MASRGPSFEKEARTTPTCLRCLKWMRPPGPKMGRSIETALNGTKSTCPAKPSKSERSPRAVSSGSTTPTRPCIGSGASRKDCSAPKEVFTQLFHEKAHDEDFAVIVRSIDWGRVRWELQEISGIALRHVRVDREYQHALDEARDRATRFDIVDDRQDVVDHWRDAGSWIIPPVAVSCDLLGGGARTSDRLHQARESASAARSRGSTGDSEAFGVGRTSCKLVRFVPDAVCRYRLLWGIRTGIACNVRLRL